MQWIRPVFRLWMARCQSSLNHLYNTFVLRCLTFALFVQKFTFLCDFRQDFCSRHTSVGFLFHCYAMNVEVQFEFPASLRRQRAQRQHCVCFEFFHQWFWQDRRDLGRHEPHLPLRKLETPRGGSHRGGSLGRRLRHSPAHGRTIQEESGGRVPDAVYPAVLYASGRPRCCRRGGEQGRQGEKGVCRNRFDVLYRDACSFGVQ